MKRGFDVFDNSLPTIAPQSTDVKRLFDSIDNSLPQSILAKHPNREHQLNRIKNLENFIDRKWTSHKRATYFLNSEPDFRSEALRVYIRHFFFKKDQHNVEKSFFLLKIEG